MSRAGTTLPELVVALVIVAVILAGGYGAFAQVSDGRDVAYRHLEPAARTAALRYTLASWLSSARVSGEEEGWAFVGFDGGGAAHDELRFVAGRADPVVEGPAQLRLFIDGDPGTPERGLVAEVRALPSEAIGRRIELSPWITDLQARYLARSPEGERWTGDWLSSLQLPAAIELTLAAAPPDSLGPLVRVPILVPLARQDTP